MLSRKVQEAMNGQFKNEYYSGYLYLAMAAHFDTNNLPGFAHWMRAQAHEELEHAMKFYHYLYERGGNLVLQAIDQPPADFGTPLEAFEQTLAHERKVTALIDDLYALAVAEKDYASQVFLQWFISEQVEEEANATAIIETIKMAGQKGQALVMLDRQLAARGAD
jgi:ferritin